MVSNCISEVSICIETVDAMLDLSPNMGKECPMLSDDPGSSGSRGGYIGGWPDVFPDSRSRSMLSLLERKLLRMYSILESSLTNHIHFAHLLCLIYSDDIQLSYCLEIDLTQERP